jgi:hypothetical protein
MQQQKNEEKPATVRIEAVRLEMPLDIPIPGPGKTVVGYVRIPAAKDSPNYVETDRLDAVTLNRLRYHYEWRPTDPKLAGKKRDELAPDQITEIGLIKITVVKPTGGKRPAEEPRGDSKAA